MVVVPDAVSPALRAVMALYGAGQYAWKFYRTVKDFGYDFEISMEALYSQEWVFGSHLEQYKACLEEASPGKVQTRPGQAWSRQQIGDRIIKITNIFNKCYVIVRHFDTGCSNLSCTQDHGPGIEDPVSGENRPRRRLRKPSDKAKERGGVGSAIVDLGGALAGIGLPLNKGQHKGGSDAIHTTPDGEIQHAPRPDHTGPPSLVTAEFFRKRKEHMQNRAKKAQKDVGSGKLIAWADHGKADFEDLIQQLKEAIRVLRDMMPLLVPDDPFKKLRPMSNKPNLWEKTEDTRVGLRGLHIAVQAINSPEPLNLAVKLEEKPEDMMARMEAGGFLDPQRKKNAMVTCLMPRVERPDGNPCPEYLVSTTITTGEHTEITSLPQYLAGLRSANPEFNVIGQMTRRGEEIYYLQRTRKQNLLGGEDRIVPCSLYVN
ncbi:hypothetical protein KVR01_011357 [Diaporthe batatas]|uniref:uncharacterized protein n=1 Tax=Diaporthe batatas TaxID=748121 RepID=UPI001D05868A|nr:uncharacterized protein KVR01_011357 [Diaporthe batatas]KAG8158914.1 hypothetical protein KVR01_011357 [Diaporthe batatas]